MNGKIWESSLEQHLDMLSFNFIVNCQKDLNVSYNQHLKTPISNLWMN